MNKAKALASHLGIKVNEARDLINNQDCLVLSDSEANSRCYDSILDSLWAFRSEFLAAHLKKGISVDVVDLIQSNGLCEGNNEAIKSLIDDLEYLVEDAIRCDGRGHFIAQYDGEEIELSNDLYAYRIN